jgi:tetratricopeptide (TPR) repeat protein
VSFRGWLEAGSIFAAVVSICGCAHHRPASEPRTDLDRAKSFLREGQPDRALPLLTELASSSPNDFDIGRLEAEAYVRAGRAGELVSALLSRPADRAVSHYMLGLVYGATADGLEASGSIAALELERAIALKPGEAELHHRLGVALLGLGRCEESVDALGRALHLDPGRTAAYLPLVKALHSLGKTEEALVTLSRWLDRSPQGPEIGAGKALMDEIAPPFEGQPSGGQAMIARGVGLLREEDDPLGAIAVFEQVLQEHPQISIAHTLLALCYQRLDEAARAIDELRRAAALAPREGRNHHYLGELYLGRGQLAQAKAALSRALELNPLLDGAHLRLGELALEESDFKSARRHLGIAASLSPSVQVRAKLARALQLNGDFLEAERELRGLLKMQPENPELMLRLGLLHVEAHGRSSSPPQRSRSRAEAVYWLREVLRVQGDNVSAAHALESLGGG